ncbi:MAG: transglycosylase SLT domain-containing protein [Arsenophonus sp. NEOnobi-MAG3]
MLFFVFNERYHIKNYHLFDYYKLNHGSTQEFYFNEVCAIYQIDLKLLKAIAQQERRLSAKPVISIGIRLSLLSVDYWLIQVNSTHIKKLKNMGVWIPKTIRTLLNQPCLNVKIGARILLQNTCANMALTRLLFGFITLACISAMKRNACSMPNRFIRITGR